MRLVRTEDARLIRSLDRLIFKGDAAISLDDYHLCAWWVARYDMPAGFCGVRKSHFREGLWFLARAGVLPRCRGNGIQKRMIRTRVNYARRHGAKEVHTYTSDDNYASANSLIACGFCMWEPPERWVGDMLYWHKEIL